MSNSNWTTANIPDQSGRIVIITGANSGIGLVAAKELAKKKATVIMAVRNPDKGAAALKEVMSEAPGANVSLMSLDLADLESVKSFAAAFHQKYDRLDLLINNAGVMYPAKRELTKQGFEIQIGTNHLGHFALTAQLLELIKNTPHARVVSQSSLAHMSGSIKLDDLNLESSYSKIQAYGQSKLANLLFTYELNRQFKAHNIDAIAIAAHPGVSKTNLMRTSGFVVELFTPLVAQPAEMGALPILRAATDQSLTGGEYIGPDGMMGLRGYPIIVKSNKKSYDTKMAKDLWALSEKLTGVHFTF
jgi:NAD(P)-dependent dehydrogenase (short-subunit alcohol dehydrogenase family)